MAMGTHRWSTITQSQFAWEREALEFLRTHLPDRDPWHAWSNFEFLDDEGKVNEVDVLVMSPRGLFLVEIKSRPGELQGDNHSWTWTTDGRRFTDDNPLILANRKAKRLASLLRRQPSVVKARLRLPFIEPVIFLSADRLKWTLDPPTRSHTFWRGRPGQPNDDGIVAALTDGLASTRSGMVDAAQARMVCRAMGEGGIRPSLRERRVGDYELKKILAEGDGWQDWEGRHVSLNLLRRIRLHPFAASANEETRRALARLAAREFQVLEGVDHPGILKVRDFKETDRGPALIFDHDDRAARLDLLLREHLQLMNSELRLHLVRQLAETLKYAHEKRLYHRALSPQSIIVKDIDQARPQLQIMNWQTAARDASSGHTVHRTSGTDHLEDYVEDPAKVYIAPEVLAGATENGPHHDVFSLGAIAYHLFAGQAPAASPLELVPKLREGSGLRISDVVDGVPQSLVDLIRFSTHPDVASRIGTMAEFLACLDEAEREIRLGPPEVLVDPAIAKPNDRIEGGFTVVRRLGRGASADALLVRPDDSDEELVLKIAQEVAQNERLRAEGEILRKLHHTNIVKIRQVLTVAGRTALLMERAGEETLAQALRSDDRPSLDLVQRYGEELLSAVNYLEEHGIAHRDIKPDNIGIRDASHSGKKHLVLFDFSLSRTPAENIQAGTRPYLDPFLALRRPPRWDLHAERFAAAMTLYEMLTGELPSWGDGRSDAALIDDEVSLQADLFHPNLRESLVAFFTRALRRDPRERFDNTEDMLRAWRKAFEAPATTVADDFDNVACRATAETLIGELGFSVEAQSVLDRLGVHTVPELLAVPRQQLRYLTGVGDRIRREIRLKAKRLAELRPDLVPGTPTPTDVGLIVPGQPSIDRLAETLVPRRPLGEDAIEERVLAVFLGIETMSPPRLWPTPGQVGNHCGIDRVATAAAIAKGRERWLKQPLLTEVRREIEVLLRANSGVMTAAELARQLLVMRGSASMDDALRQRLAAAVVRAAAEAEAALETPRFLPFEDDAVPVVAQDIALAIHAQALGAAADRLAQQDPLATPQRVREELEALDWPSDWPPPQATRLLALAVGCSTSAALSSRQEIYPRGMAAERALRLALGSLLGPRVLTEDQVRERVRGRYPEAAPLPSRPALDELLRQAGAGRVWRDGDEPGYHVERDGLAGSSGISSVHRTRTEGPAVEQTPAVLAAEQLEEKLDYALKTGGFLALTIEPRRFRLAEAELLRRFPLRRVSIDALMLEALRHEATARKVDWSLVLRADAADRGSRDWTNLQRLVGLAAPRIEKELRGAKERLLLVDAGLLARYDLMGLLQRLSASAGTADGPPGLWMLLPQDDSGLPTIGGRPVPVIGPSQWGRLTTTWLSNAHRAGLQEAVG